MTWLETLNARFAAALFCASATPGRAIATLLLLCLTLYLPGQASLPPTDRDESRFAQATKQMLESGDFIDIRFQDTPRYKKPIGIHWLQSLSAGALTDGARNEIWAYRIPSLIGIIAAVILTWWLARPLFGRETALMAAMLLAASVTVAFEARIAKSDAVLLTFIVLAQGALARIYMFGRKRSEMTGIAAVFWIALGLSILIKGPVGPVVIGLAIAALAFFGRDRLWMKNLHAAWGIPLLLTITLPWFIAIAIISEGQFFQGSVGKDFLQKLIGGEEKHGAPPGFYLVSFWWSFWPGALIATGGAALWLWRNRVRRRALLLLAMIVPFWLVVEIVPTKLPNYIMPIYPAVAVAAVWVLRDQLLRGLVPMRTYRQGAALFLFVTALQLGAFGFALWLFEAEFTLIYAAGAIAVAALASLAAIGAWRGQFYAGSGLAVASAMIMYLAAFPHVLPELRPVWPAQRALEAAAPFKPCLDGPVAFAGYNEPSAVFLHGTETKLVSADAAAASLADGSVAYAFVSGRRLARFEAALKERGAALPAPIACANGVDVNGGGLLDFKLYSLKADNLAACRPAPLYACNSGPRRWERWLSGK